MGLNTVLLWAHLHGNGPLLLTSGGSDSDGDDGSSSEGGGAALELLMLAVSLRRERIDGRPALARDARVLRAAPGVVVARGTSVKCKLAGDPDALVRLEEYFESIGALCVSSALSVTQQGNSGDSALCASGRPPTAPSSPPARSEPPPGC